MKSDRRRELKHNALADSLRRLPIFLNKYGPYLATGLIAAAGIGWYFYNRHESNLQHITVAQEDLNTAQQNVQRLRDDTLEIYTKGDHVRVTDGKYTGQEGDIDEVVPQRGTVWVTPSGQAEPMEFEFNQIEEVSPIIDAQELIASRRAYYTNGLRAAQEAYGTAPADQSAIRAQALVCQGDLNFALANLPALPGAASDPSLAPEQPVDVLMDNAKTAYEQVLRDYPSDDYASSAAHIGLAAIAENSAAREDQDAAQADWATARSQYQAVIQSGAPAAMRDYANNRQKAIVAFSKPLLKDIPGLVPTTMPSTLPSTQPSTLPATMPFTLPLTMPSTMPSTVPATLPTTGASSDSITLPGNCGYSGATTITPGTVVIADPNANPSTSPATRP